MRSPRRPRRPANPLRSARQELPGWTREPEYLAFKEQMGVPLAESERAALDAHRESLGSSGPAAGGGA